MDHEVQQGQGNQNCQQSRGQPAVELFSSSKATVTWYMQYTVKKTISKEVRARVALTISSHFQPISCTTQCENSHHHGPVRQNQANMQGMQMDHACSSSRKLACSMSWWAICSGLYPPDARK